MALVVSVEMGYGHLRAAAPIAEALGVPVALADRPPMADDGETARWRRTRVLYEALTRLSQKQLGGPLRPLLSGLTAVPGGTFGPRMLARLISRGLGRGVVEAARADRMVSTFYAPPVAADLAGIPSCCVVTDVDVNRVWAPLDTAATRIRFLVPAERTRARLASYGVPPARITVTGFPLSRRLTAEAGDTFRARLDRLAAAKAGRGPLRLAFSVGGAGAQAGLPARFLPALARSIREGRIEVTLVAGCRKDTAVRLQRAARRAGLTDRVEVLFHPDPLGYLGEFERILAGTDLLWTKPSELSFFAALGIPLLLSQPVGAHEAANRDYLLETGAAVEAGPPGRAGEWLPALVSGGRVEEAARSGFERLPREGLARIAEAAALL